jgi:hypothetical protein
MQRPSILLFLTLALSLPGIQLHAAGTDYHWPCAPEDFQHKILGTWALVSVEAVNPDGSRSQPFGPHPVGRAVFDSRGNFILLNMAAAFVVGQRPESQGIFGTYTVDEAARTLTWHVDASTSSKPNGADWTHSIEVLTDDNLRTMLRGASAGEAALLFTWRRFE